MFKPNNKPEQALRRHARFMVLCPHCDARANVRTSVQQTPLHREIYYQCSNMFCGFAFVATLEIVRMVTPSHTPRPGVRLSALEPGSHRRIFQDEPATPPANDEAPETRNTG